MLCISDFGADIVLGHALALVATLPALFLALVLPGAKSSGVMVARTRAQKSQQAQEFPLIAQHLLLNIWPKEYNKGI